MGYKVKLSNKILITGFFIPIISFIIVISILSGKETADEMYQFRNAPEFILLQSGKLIKEAGNEQYQGDHIQKKFNFTDYTILKFEGGWDIRVKESSEEIYLSGFRELIDKVSVEQDGEILIFKVNKLNQAVMVEANISMPKLRGITTKGPANIYITDIGEAEEVLIKCEGVANIVSDNISIRSLVLKSQGGLNADLLNGFINKLELDYQAVGSIDAYFKDGQLSGSMAGSGTLNAYGKVLSNRIELKSEKVKVEIK